MSLADNSLTISFSEPLEATSTNPSSVRLMRAGEDGLVGTRDDVHVHVYSVSLSDPTTVRVQLGDPPVTDEPYLFTVRESLSAADLAEVLALEVSGELLPPQEL